MNRILPNPAFLPVIQKFKDHGQKEKLVAVFNGGGACGAFEFGAAMFLKDIG